MATVHYPVLKDEVIALLSSHLPSGTTIIDGTLGNAGHSIALAQKKYHIIGLDRNLQSLNQAKLNIANYKDYISIYQDNFTNFLSYSKYHPKAIFLDLGLSVSQLKDYDLGLSFNDDNLDMRLDTKTKITAKDLVNDLSVSELTDIIGKLSQEKLSQPIAKNIVKFRTSQLITSAKQLAQIVTDTYRQYHQTSKLHPATKTFLALKIVVNQEVENLKLFLQETLSAPNGFLVVVITFHSTEDRILKNFLRKNRNLLQIEKAIFPSKDEIAHNPPSRSAILRSYIIKPCL